MLNDSRLSSPRNQFSLYRKPTRTHVLCFTILPIIFTCCLTSSSPAQRISAKVARFVGEVMVGREYEKENLVAMKWEVPAKLSVFGANREQTRVIQNAVRKINDALEPTEMRIDLLDPEDTDATLKVYFANLDDFEPIVQREKIEYVEGNWGYFFVRWNRDYFIDSGVVLLASDRLRGEELKHIAMEEITQSLGLPGDSKRFPSSLFYENIEDRRYGHAMNLSGLDAKTLRFLYQKVEPGMHAVELGLLMAQHWANAK